MNIEMVMWVLAGGILGWLGYSYMGFNQRRGITVSVVIGAIGGLVGGQVIAPMFTATAAAPDRFNVFALFIATAVAAAFLFAGHVVHDRLGV